MIIKWSNTKGHLISKGLFGILNSPKKQTKKFDFTTIIPQVNLFSFIFWEKLKTPKRHFKVNCPLELYLENFKVQKINRVRETQ